MASKVLLVEDDNNLREIYEARLMAEGYEIALAQDGEEALVVAKKERPDLIISDVMMPRVSGFDMLDILRNTDGLKDTKVIMLTALGQAEDRSRADQLGADRYLVKSQVTLEDIVKSAQDLLNGGSNSIPQAEPASSTAISATEPAAAVPPPVPSQVPPTVAAVPTAPLAPVTPPPVAAVPVLPQQPGAPAAPAATPPVTPTPPVGPGQSNDQLISDALKDLTGVAPTAAPAASPPPAAEQQNNVKPMINEDEVMKKQIDEFVNSQPTADAPQTTPGTQSAPVDIPVAQPPSQDSSTPPPAAAPAPPLPPTSQAAANEDDSVVVAHKKIIAPLNGPVQAEPDINELLQKEGNIAQAPAPVTTDVGGTTGSPSVAADNNTGTLHPPGHVISPSPTPNDSGTPDNSQPVDPNSIAL